MSRELRIRLPLSLSWFLAPSPRHVGDDRRRLVCEINPRDGTTTAMWSHPFAFRPSFTSARPTFRLVPAVRPSCDPPRFRFDAPRDDSTIVSLRRCKSVLIGSPKCQMSRVEREEENRDGYGKINAYVYRASQGTSSLRSSLVIRRRSCSWMGQRPRRRVRFVSAYYNFFEIVCLIERRRSWQLTINFKALGHSRGASHVQSRHPAKSLTIPSLAVAFVR